MKTRKNGWTKEDEWYIKNLWYLTDEALSIIIGKTRQAVQQRKHIIKKREKSS